MPAAITPVSQTAINLIAHRGSYSIDVNPRLLLINGLGVDDFIGGSNICFGQSAGELDALLTRLGYYAPGQPRATIGPEILIDTGGTECIWTRATVSDVTRLRAAFYALYGLGKPDWYGRPV